MKSKIYTCLNLHRHRRNFPSLNLQCDDHFVIWVGQYFGGKNTKMRFKNPPGSFQERTQNYTTVSSTHNWTVCSVCSKLLHWYGLFSLSRLLEVEAQKPTWGVAMMQGTSSRTTFWCAVKQRVLQIDTKAPYLDCNFGFSVLHIEAPWPMHSPSCRSCPPLTPLVTSVVISESGRPGPLDQGLVSGWQTYSNATQCIYHFWTVFSPTGRCWRNFFQSFKSFMADHWGCWTF